MSIITFSIFAVCSFVILYITKKYSIAIGCVLFSAISIIKHVKNPNVKHVDNINLVDEKEPELVGKV